MTLLGWDGGLKGCFWAQSDCERWRKSPQIRRCSREAWHVWRCLVLCSFPWFLAPIVFVPFTNLQIWILLSIISKLRPGWSSRWCEPLSRKQKVILRLNGKHITHEPIFCWHLNKVVLILISVVPYFSAICVFSAPVCHIYQHFHIHNTELYHDQQIYGSLTSLC